MVTRSDVAQAVALVFVLLPAFAAGALPEPFIAALLLLAGLFLLFFRPVAPLPRSFAYAAGALIVASSLAFLPVSWFGTPEWRTSLASYGNVALGGMVTPQPWHTLQRLSGLMAGLAFGLFLLCQPVSGRNHRWLAGAFSLGVAAYAAFSIFAADSGWRHPWDIYGTFGFFPNRNHVGTLLAMGAVAGLGPFWDYLMERRWVPAAALGAAITLISIASLGYCESRAASLMLFAGIFIWLAGVFKRNLDRRMGISALTLALFALVVFVTSQTPAMQRLRRPAPTVAPSASLEEQKNTLSTEKSVPFDFRMLLYQDVCRMIADHPITGIGLGNFRYISQQYREISLSQSLAIHSDNSWLLIAAEAGLPAAGAVVALVALAFLRLRGCRRHPSWSIRWASATAVIVFLGHCIVDIPAHRDSTLLPAIFLAGLAFRRSSTHASRATFSLKASRVFFLIAGAAFVATAVWLSTDKPETGSKLPSIEVDKTVSRINALHQQRRDGEAIALAQEALLQTPLDAELYFLWGALELNYLDEDGIVDNLFTTQRILEPHFIATPMQQAEAWIQIKPERALPLYAEAMERARQQDRRTPGHYAHDTFEQILYKSAKFPQLNDKLLPLTGNVPELLLRWGNNASTVSFHLLLQQILTNDPVMARWTPEEQRKLFRLCYRKGERDQAQRLLRDNPALENAAWPILAGDLARNREHESAWRLAESKLHFTALDRSYETLNSTRLRTLFKENKNLSSAERVARALLKELDFAGALKFVTEAQASGLRSANLSRAASIAAASQSLWPEAWNHLVAMLRVSQPDLAPE